eukprot:Skav225475  [mRNA]  locus=scaffold3604:147602:150947:- [translate_table: standard]
MDWPIAVCGSVAYGAIVVLSFDLPATLVSQFDASFCEGLLAVPAGPVPPPPVFNISMQEQCRALAHAGVYIYKAEEACHALLAVALTYVRRGRWQDSCRAGLSRFGDDLAPYRPAVQPPAQRRRGPNGRPQQITPHHTTPHQIRPQQITPHHITPHQAERERLNKVELARVDGQRRAGHPREPPTDRAPHGSGCEVVKHAMGQGDDN